MNFSDFQQCYRKFLEFHMDLIKIKDLILFNFLYKQQSMKSVEISFDYIEDRVDLINANMISLNIIRQNLH